MVRKEHFGALVYDRERGDYIPFDADAAMLFEQALARPIAEAYPLIEHRLTRQSFETFVQLCRSIDLIDAEGRLAGEFATPRPLNGVLSAPLRVQLQITNQCLLRCKHCSQDTRDALPNELTLDEIKKLLDEMAEMGTCQVILSGGEPFLRPDLLQIVKHARMRGLSVSLSTTGTSVNRVLAKKMAEVGLKSVRVSFDGAAEKSYDYYRGVKGAYRKAMRGLKTLREIFPKTPIVLHTTLMRPNTSEILAIARMVSKLQLNTWSLDFVKPVGQAAEQGGLWLAADEGDDLVKRLGKIVENFDVPLKMAHFPYKGQVTQGGIFGYRCQGGNLFTFISANGSVAPCSFTARQFPVGNIRRKSLRDIWAESEMLRKFRQSVAGPQACSACMKAEASSIPNLKFESYAFVMPTATAPVS